MPGIATISTAEATEIRRRLTKTELCICLSKDNASDENFATWRELSPEYYLVDIRQAWTPSMIAVVRSCAPKLIVAGLVLDYDDDVSSLLEAMKELTTAWEPFCFHLTLTPSQRSPLEWFRNESGQYEEDITVADVERVATIFPVLLNVDMDGEGCQWFEQQLPSVRGWFWWPGTPTEESRAPVVVTRESVLQLLLDAAP